MSEYTRHTATVRNGTIEWDDPIPLPEGASLDILLRVVESEEERTPEEEKIEDEMAWFVAHHAELLEQYRGQYIAIHHHAVVDQDTNENALYLRVGDQWGEETPVLITFVNDKPIREFFVHSFRFERDT